jgi:hypothetical protein
VAVVVQELDGITTIGHRAGLAVPVVVPLRTTGSQAVAHLFKTTTVALLSLMEILGARHGVITVLKPVPVEVEQVLLVARHLKESGKQDIQVPAVLADLSPLVDQTFC